MHGFSVKNIMGNTLLVKNVCIFRGHFQRFVFASLCRRREDESNKITFKNDK